MDCWDIKLFMNHGLQKVENFWPPLKKFGGVKKIFFCIFVMSVYRTTYLPKIIQFRVGPVKSCVHLTWNAPEVFQINSKIWKYSWSSRAVFQVWGWIYALTRFPLPFGFVSKGFKYSSTTQIQFYLQFLSKLWILTFLNTRVLLRSSDQIVE